MWHEPTPNKDATKNMVKGVASAFNNHAISGMGINGLSNHFPAARSRLDAYDDS